MFEILTADGGLGGTRFDDVVVPALAGDLGWFVEYGLTEVTLVTTFAADFDRDGDVDADDLIQWQADFGENG